MWAGEHGLLFPFFLPREIISSHPLQWPSRIRKHEVQFCADVSKFLDRYFELHPQLPFGSSDVESFTRGTSKRHDLRIYERAATGKGKLALCAEVKLPGTPYGSSPFHPALIEDASSKADREDCRYFLTWNVEHLALFDRSQWERPLIERCVDQWQLGIELNKPGDVSRPDVVARLYREFLPRFVSEFAEIYEGRRRALGQPLSDL